ncbi:hypothetical protein [Flavihumibacter sp. CACIAM 22H1]|uniref:hypothetical protein n=1 Tax=Flavihumibacter sp. CACIAM 22H1 TaxID=1812911 RepID=UPI0007A7F30A|nr:hypothetical protein [Flavihumibacter sp. CACIAM 22H1]KYP16171.1 MAG: hypothetical protein A1D16_13990 [Flavihumibacter sp. CACIAM 22H1]
MSGYNPFFPFHFAMIDRLRKMGHRYLVSQTYLHDFDPMGKTILLMSDYDKENIAKIHFNALQDDRFKAILNLENEKHRFKLAELLQSNSAYRVYSAFLADKAGVKQTLKDRFEPEIRRYLRNHTKWQIAGKDSLLVHLEVIFGELYLVMHYRGQQQRIALAELNG